MHDFSLSCCYAPSRLCSSPSLMLWLNHILIYVAAVTRSAHEHQSASHPVSCCPSDVLFVYVCIKVKPGFMHERSCELDEPMRFLRSCSSSCRLTVAGSRLRYSVLYHWRKLLTLQYSPWWPRASFTNPRAQVLSASAGWRCIYWSKISITALTRTAEPGRVSLCTSVDKQHSVIRDELDLIQLQ